MTYQCISTTAICLQPIKRVHKKCKIEGCDNKSQIGGVCVKHGAKTPRCKIEGCENKSQKNGVCVKHGAKIPRCKIEECESKSKQGGVCTKHGAY